MAPDSVAPVSNLGLSKNYTKLSFQVLMIGGGAVKETPLPCAQKDGCLHIVHLHLQGQQQKVDILSL